MSRPGLHDYTALVELPVRRHLFSLLDGVHQGIGAGNSQEFLDMAEYRAGDDIQDIDWKATARLGAPVIKRFEAASVLSVYLVVDSSSAMAALAADGKETKEEVAEEFATAITWLTAMRGDLLGLVAGNADQVETVPARVGTSHSQTILRMVTRPQVDWPPGDLAKLLSRVDKTVPRRSLILVVADRAGITEAALASLRRLQMRHWVGVLLVEDFDPTTADVGAVSADVLGGELPSFVAGHPQIAAQWKAAVAQQRSLAGRGLRRYHIPFAAAGSRTQVLPALIELFESGGTRGRTR